ncbi:MAG: recombination mediator RecR [Bacteriovoracaceae bacterium]|jgi:recombination protein RecR|nr:recombination mediator RecR [Bacteriovoracaceae bacterium]
MIELPQSIQDCVESFSKLPGVGGKTALRQVMAMSKWQVQDLLDFSNAINELQTLNKCSECGVLSDSDICKICSNEFRKDSSVICVVENISDLMAIEKSNNFSGLFHILGGVLNPLAGIGPSHLRIDKLIERVKKLDTKSIILAINPSVEGDATCAYIKQLLGEHINVERIGFGIPIGGSLELLDPMTISKALENRKILE